MTRHQFKVLGPPEEAPVELAASITGWPALGASTPSVDQDSAGRRMLTERRPGGGPNYGLRPVVCRRTGEAERRKRDNVVADRAFPTRGGCCPPAAQVPPLGMCPQRGCHSRVPS